MAAPPVDELVKQIENAKGNVSAVARAYKVTRQTAYNWINASAKAKQAIVDERRSMVDVAISALYRNVLAGKESSIFYTLNNSPEAKLLGWGPRHEIAGVDDKPILEVVYVNQRENNTTSTS